MSARTCDVRSRYSCELETPEKLSSICPRRASLRGVELRLEADWGMELPGFVEEAMRLDWVICST
jgi:transcription initiation factor TFIID subunit TAF12